MATALSACALEVSIIAWPSGTSAQGETGGEVIQACPITEAWSSGEAEMLGRPTPHR